MNSIRQNKGFSMAEVLAVSFIFLVVAGIVYTLFKNSQVLFNVGEERVHLQTKLRVAMDFIKDELRQADSSSIIILNDGAVINFTISAGVGGGSVVWSQPINYSIDETTGNLIRSQGGINMVLAENITALNFTLTEQRIVDVLLTGSIDSVAFRVKIRKEDAL